MTRLKYMTWAEIAFWSALSGLVVLIVVAAIFIYVYFNDGSTKVWFDGLSQAELALQCTAVWFVPALAVFGFLTKVRIVEDESVAKAGDFIEKLRR